MARSPRDPQELLPLAPLPFHILLALSEGERHGYAIRKSAEETSEGTLRPGAGSLYHAIKGLLAEGLIDEAEERPDPHLDDERRRYYRLTAFGRQVARAEMARLTILLKRARRFPGLGKEEA
ncbi:MAG TPA: PadR family transcriptional regulator [Bryobacteraceae bacterium]|nr:PadR family transcriptional regulator [Bryobacteraceae bacterium]